MKNFRNSNLAQAWLVLLLATFFGTALAGIHMKLNPVIEANKIKETILNTIRDNQGTEDRLMWETLKLKIRGESITYSAKKKRHRKNIIALLEHKIQKYEKEFDLNNSEEIETTPEKD